MGREILVAVIPEQIAQLGNSFDSLQRSIKSKLDVPPLWTEDKAGSCARMDGEVAQQDIVSHARDRILELWEERNRETPGTNEITACPYHRTEGGCSLGSLKPPLCLTTVDNAPAIEDQFGIEINRLALTVYVLYVRALGARTLGDAALNQILINQTVAKINALNEYVETSP